MSIWSTKGLESPIPPVKASGNALQTSRLCHIENLTFCILFKYLSYIKSAMLICWKEYALLSGNEICREHALFSNFSHRVDSDKCDLTYGQKHCDWSLWFEELDVKERMSNSHSYFSGRLKKILCLESLQNSIEILKFSIIRILAKSCRRFSFLCTLPTFEGDEKWLD